MKRPSSPRSSDSVVIAVFALVGEHRDDPGRLLLL